MSYFKGEGQQTDHKNSLPQIYPDALTNPKGYRASSELAQAVNVALTLGMPLLLTGEPGSGKSRLAHCIAWELQLGQKPEFKPLEFTVKSDTKGRDLFYSYDTLGRFHAVQVESKDETSADKLSSPQDFIHFNALGRAILEAKEPSFAYGKLGLSEKRFQHPGEPRRSVVLIDEIDKAPRDVPNDLLSEIDNLSFRIPELETILGQDLLIELDQESKEKSDQSGEEQREPPRLRTPIVIITSNSEKSLPEAFLRRCVYYHVPFPAFSSKVAGEITVESIVHSRLGERYKNQQSKSVVKAALTFFQYLRQKERGLSRKPSMAELLNWIDYLLQLDCNVLDKNDSEIISSIKTVLLKSKTDQKSTEDIQTWLSEAEK